jgi:hypothetical protein
MSVARVLGWLPGWLVVALDGWSYGIARRRAERRRRLSLRQRAGA